MTSLASLLMLSLCAVASGFNVVGFSSMGVHTRGLGLRSTATGCPARNLQIAAVSSSTLSNSLSQSTRRSSAQLLSSSDYILDTFDPEEEEDELSNENLLKIVYSETPDQEVNLLAWKCLGYVQDEATGKWNNDNVFPKWKEKYPQPPDLIGVLRNYTYTLDRPVQKANQAIVASIPMAYKQGIKTQLRPLGFTGFKLDELTPNKTRRAQVVNWMLFYREALRGKTIEQLQAEREGKAAAEQASEAFPKVVGADSRQDRSDDSSMKEQTTWKYPERPIL